MATSEDLESASSSSIHEESDITHNCTPCDTDGEQRTAVGYCVDCQEHLCRRCFDGHLVPSVTRKHVLEAISYIKGAVTDEDTDLFTRVCPKHKGEVINYYCSGHGFFGCHICFFDHQKDCKETKCIPGVRQDVVNDELRYITDQLTSIGKTCTKLATECQDNVQTITDSNTKTVANIREFATEVFDTIDQLKRDLLSKTDKIKEDDLLKNTEFSDKCNAMLKKIQVIENMLKRLQKDNNQEDLYFAIVKSRESLKGMEADLNSVAKKISKREISFKANKDLIQTLRDPLALGRLDDTRAETTCIEKAKHILDINIKSATDTSACRPIGSTLCFGGLVVTDHNNMSIKLIDIEHNKVLLELKLSSRPLGVCKLSETEVAVAEERKIVFVKKEHKGLSIEREFPIKGTHHGIDYCDGKLVLSYTSSPIKVEILDLKGQVLQTFINDDQGKPIFQEPYHLAVNQSSKLIYVSNYRSNSIVCMRFDGTVVARYTDSELNYPMQVIVDGTGMVYVCGGPPYTVHQLTEDCKKVKILLSSDNGLNGPESISYDQDRRKLYVGQSNGIVKVFDVTCATVNN